jgi:hypothetical protein
MKTCAGPACTRQARVGELCKSHHQQMARRGWLSELRPRAEKDCAEIAYFRLPGELLEAAQAAARSAGISAAQWWRDAGRSKLGAA